MSDLEIIETPADVESARFVVDDDSKADWALGKLAGLRAKVEEINTRADAAVQRVEVWRHNEAKSLAGDIAYFESLLWLYAKQERAQGRKSFRLINGEVKTRETKGRIDITDTEALIEWAQSANPDLVTTKVEVRKSDLGQLARAGDQLVTNSGEIVPGVTVGEPSVNVTIETSA